MVDGDEPVSVCAGYRAVEVNDAVQGASLSVRFLYRARARAPGAVRSLHAPSCNERAHRGERAAARRRLARDGRNPVDAPRSRRASRAAEGALSNVSVPILMRTAEKDPHTEPFHGQVVERGLRDPGQLDHQVVPNAGHFAFLSAYPVEMRSPAILPSQDPDGFDRAAYLPVLFDEIVTFLRRIFSLDADHPHRDPV